MTTTPAPQTPEMPLPVRMLEPQRIAADTYVIRQLGGEGVAPAAIPLNSAVILAEEPVIIDTGMAVTRREWMDTAFSIVDPADVKWIFLSHDDVDHVGNLLPVLDACPDATVVTTSFMVERMMAEFGLAIPMDRMRWVNDGESFSAGDRTLTCQIPPTFDSPCTRGLFDHKTGVYWASDSFGNPVTHEVEDIDELDAGFWREGFLSVQSYVSPWHRWLDPVKYGQHLDKVRSLGATTIASGHGVTLHGEQIASAFALLEELPHMPPAPLETQADLEAQMAAVMAMSGAPVEQVAA